MTTVTDPAPVADPLSVIRLEIHPLPDEPDPLAHATLAQARLHWPQISNVRTARIFLIEAPLDSDAVSRIGQELLADPVTQRAVEGASPLDAGAAAVEVHYQPGVMDPVAQSTRDAIVEMFPHLTPEQIEVRTGWRFVFTSDASAQSAGEGVALSAEKLREFAARQLANPVIQDIHLEAYHPQRFAHGSPYEPRIVHVPIRDLDDAALTKMSREAHLFLSLDEMRAVRDYFRAAGREPTDIELETLAQTWSEHCVHKTLKSRITYRHEAASAPLPYTARGAINARPGHSVNDDGSITIDNLLKSTVAAATFELMKRPGIGEWCISVFKDNAGIVAFDDQDAICIKVETHNHPSAIEPYGGAATGIGGCIRDVMGTGLAARPIANTDSFCVAPPDFPMADLPRGVIHPRRTLQQVVAGVRDYGNRMGIPTVNGAVWFHPDYLANPLVFAGCVGMMPRDKCFGAAEPGDHIIVLGGRTGRDGIHGATFSSAELTDTHADEFAHAVQIGNAITQKKTLDVILQARDPIDADGTPLPPLFTAITDCGAGGFSSAVGEMGAELGATVQLDGAPLKYQGLSYTEIWISEAQERMVLAVPAKNLAKIKALADAEDVEMCDLGTFGVNGANGEPELVLNYRGQEVGRLSMNLLHEGIPTPMRQATWAGSSTAAASQSPNATSASASAPASNTTNSDDIAQTLIDLLAHPNIASKHWIIRQYDHEVQGSSVVKPLVGPHQDGPSDAAVIRPKLSSNRAIALANGLAPGLGEKTPGGDSYWATLAAIDEAVRNVVCVGADPQHIAILDNFCWPRCDDPRQLGSLVRAAEACYDGAMAFGTPFVSGKDSLSNQFTTEDGKLITIPPTLLITAMGIVPDAMLARTMDAKAAGNAMLIVGMTDSAIGGSHYQMVRSDDSRDRRIAHTDLVAGPTNARAVASLIAKGLVASAHDCSDGGMLAAAAEMALAGRIGLELDLDALPTTRQLDDVTACFAETPSRYLLEVTPANLDAVVRSLRQASVPFGQVGIFASHDRVKVRSGKQGRVVDVDLMSLREAWRGTLDW